MANPDPSPKDRIRPGEVRNPTGKKGLRLAERLRRRGQTIVTLSNGTKGKAIDILVANVWARAIDGNMEAVKWLADRTEGKVVERHKIKGDTPTKIIVQYVDDFEGNERHDGQGEGGSGPLPLPGPVIVETINGPPKWTDRTPP